jgi:4-hydroxybenzoate polyprenyltransferase
MIRFSHTVFALPFALTSAALAWNRGPGFQWLQLVGILLCMVFARSAAMSFNRLADRRIDAANPRTSGRHLPAGRLTVGSVWGFTAVCVGGFLACTLIFWFGFANPWPTYLAVPVLLFVGAYSYTKRFTALSHFWLGASLLLAPVAAWIAIRGLDFNEMAVPLVLGGAVLCWVAGFDILYACQDVEFDRKARLHSVPAALGVRSSLRVALGCHVVMLVLLAALDWVTPDLGMIYLAGLGAVALLLAYEHWLVRPDDLTRVNQAFFQVNGVISVGLFVVVLLQLAWGA